MQIDAATAQSQLLAASLMQPPAAPAAGASAQKSEPKTDPVKALERNGIFTKAGVLKGGALVTGSPLTLGQLMSQERALMRQLAKEMTQAFLGAGIVATEPVELAIGPDGSIEVLGNHPEAMKIEQIFADNPALLATYQAAAKASAAVAHVRADLEFNRRWSLLESSDDEEKEKKKLMLEETFERLHKQIDAASTRMEWSGGELTNGAAQLVAGFPTF